MHLEWAIMKKTFAAGLALSFALLATGCGSPSIAGKYKIEQDGMVFGEGAEKGVFDLREDSTFDLTMGPVTLFKGKWRNEAGVLNLTPDGSSDIAVTYKVEGEKLIPQKDGAPITTWRFVRS